MNSHWLPALISGPLRCLETRSVLQAGRKIQKGELEGQRKVINQSSRSTNLGGGSRVCGEL